MTIQYVPPVTWVDNPEDFMKFARHVRNTGECAHDTETTGLNRSTDHVLFWSACPDEQTRYCFSREMLRLWDAELAKDQDIKWYYTNQTFDFDMLMNSGVRVPLGDSYCTLAMDWLLDENRQGRHGLKETALDYLGLNMREFKEAFKGKKKGESYHERLLRAMEEEFESATSYASLDAWATFRVFHELKRRLQAEDSDGMCLWDYFEEVEMPFTRVLHSCSRRGIRVDLNYLEELSPKLEADIVKLQRKISKLAGTEVNPNSPKQLQRLFFDKLGLKPIKMTSGGASGNRQPSTDASCLEIWAADGVEAAELILQHRELAKMKGTYVDGLRKWVDTNLRIHPTLTQHVTVTGRLSSVDPNLQNLPRAGTDKYAIRSAFRAKPGHILIVADYEQLEMRLLAHFSQDPNMIDVIRKGWDIHTGTASLMFGYEYEEIKAALKKNKLATKDENVILTALEIAMCFSRQSSKSIGFGQHLGRIKTHSKRGNLTALRTAIPCCAARRSVSTCDHRQMVLNGTPVSIRSGSQSRKFPLTRWAKSIRSGICQRQPSSASIVIEKLNGLGTPRNVVLIAVGNTTCVHARNAGTAPTRKWATINRAPKTTTGVVGAPLTTTKKWLMQPMETAAYVAANRQSLSTTWTKTDITVLRPILSRSANAAIRLRYTTAPKTCRNTLRRYSQCPVKAGNYTINYGEGSKKLAKTLGVSIQRAKELMAQYFEPYPDVKNFIESVHAYLLDNAKVETILGRPRRFHEMVEIGKMLDKRSRWNLPGTAKKNLARAERQSLNSVIQGSAADVARVAMIKCELDIRLRRLKAGMLLQVHDELIFEVPEENADEAMKIVKENMEHPFADDLLVPLDVDCGKGYAWSEAKA